MLSAFGDDSADEHSQRVFCVAAVVGSQEHWDALEEKWRAKLGSRIFHAADCESDRKAFRHTSHDDNQRLYRNLVKILADSSLLSYAHVVDLTALRRVFHDGMPPRDSQFYFCFIRVLSSCARAGYLSMPQEPVKFTFDERKESKWNTTALYRYATRLRDWKYVNFIADEIAFAVRASIGIQVADLVAREAMKESDRVLQEGRDLRDSFRALSESLRLRVNFYTEGYIREMRGRVERLDSPHSQAEYREWLKKRRIKTDNISRRIEFLAYSDAKAGLVNADGDD